MSVVSRGVDRSGNRHRETSIRIDIVWRQGYYTLISEEARQ